MVSLLHLLFWVGLCWCRRLFYVFGYFLFFQNVVVGLVSSLLRIIFSVVLGLVLFFRLDRVVLMKGFEVMDQGRPCQSLTLQLTVFL